MVWISDLWKDFEVLDTSEGERLANTCWSARTPR